MNFDLSLYLVTDRSLSLGRPLIDVVEQAVKGGVTMVQLREKNCNSKEFYKEAYALKKLLVQYKVPLIINDRLDIALAVDADGLHIGQQDLPYPIARQLLGDDKIIGLSIENKEQLHQANQWDVDYIGLSPVFDTSTKTNTAKALGIQGVKEFTKLSKHPSVGIGGVNLTNAVDIIHAGANGLAVVSAIMSQSNPLNAARDLQSIIQTTKRKNNNEKI